MASPPPAHVHARPKPTSTSTPTPSLARLQALAQNHSQSHGDLDHQLHHAARIVGLPDDWHALPAHARPHAFHRVVAARAEYVLRLLLQKLKDAGDVGDQARASCTAWTLLDCTLHILPVSRCAPLLRDAHFPTILENALRLRPANSTHQLPSPKRKRGSASTIPPRPPQAHPAALFHAIQTAVQSVCDKADPQAAGQETIQSEHMKMVLRTESAQAARILSNWLTTLHTILEQTPDVLQKWDILRLSQLVHVWHLRAVDTDDLDQFSAECLVPALLLSHTLRHTTPPDADKFAHNILILDRLITKHVLLPSRAAFFHASDNSAVKQIEPSSPPKADFLSLSLTPLSAKLLEAAQIQDTAEEIPAYFSPLFAAVPHLLRLVIRSSPAHTPKARILEKPWIQASLVTLAHSVGCTLAPSEFAAPGPSIAALVECLTTLASHNVIVDTSILRDIFWFHSGFTYPLDQNRVVNWPLVAALIKIDSSIFLIDPKLSASSSDQRPNDLAAFLFEKVSAFRCESSGVDGNDDAMDVEGATVVGAPGNAFSREDMIQKVIVPVINAFSRNRQLLAFIEKWDHELCRTAPTHPGPLIDAHSRIWDDYDLLQALARVLEQSLTPSQFLTLFQKHAERLHYTKNQLSKALSSAVIIQAILYTIESEGIVDSLQPTMLLVWKTYETWIQIDDPGQPAALTIAWRSLSWLLKHLWSFQFHASAALQKEYVQSLLERASKYVTSEHQEEPHPYLHSSSRAAAVTFIFVACDLLSALPGATELVKKRLEKTLKAISSGQLESDDMYATVGLFCADYTQLLGILSARTATKVLSRLWTAICKLDVELRGPLIETLSNSIFRRSNVDVNTAFISVLLDGMDHLDTGLRTNSISALVNVQPRSLPREQREATLDRLLALLSSFPFEAAPILNIMMQLMGIPNATAIISSNGNAFFDIAQALHRANVESSPATDLLEILVQLTLSHLVPNKDQAQNKLFFEHYRNNLKSALKTPRTCSPAILAILTGTMSAASGWKALLPLTHYIDYLSNALNASSTAPEFVLRAYNRIPLTVLQDEHDIIDSSKVSLHDWISPRVYLGSIEEFHFESVSIDAWPPVFGAISRYRLYPDKEWLLRVASQLLCAGVSEQGILQGLQTALAPLRNSEKMDLLDFSGVLARDYGQSVTYKLLYIVVCSLDDEQEVDAATKIRQMALLFHLCTLLEEAQDDPSLNLVLDSIDEILRHKPTMTSQHNIESLLGALHKLSTRKSSRLGSAHASAIYTRLCEMTRILLLLQHCRSRLRGRFHLLLPLLSNLLLCLFIPNFNRGTALPSWLYSSSDSTPHRLTRANAAHYARLLTTLCSPTQASVQKTHSGTTLNDPVKAAREYASQHVSTLLSSFCRFTLNGRLDAEVREKLMPGIWEVISVAQLNKDGIDAMFAGLGKSEQDVWRGVWGEWIRLGGGKERKEG